MNRIAVTGSKPTRQPAGGGEHELPEAAGIDGRTRAPVADDPAPTRADELHVDVGRRVGQRRGEPQLFDTDGGSIRRVGHGCNVLLGST